MRTKLFSLAFLFLLGGCDGGATSADGGTPPVPEDGASAPVDSAIAADAANPGSDAMVAIPGELLAFDDFEYAVSRDEPGASAAFAANGPWQGAKTVQDGRDGARGYLYTTESIPGYTGAFPGTGSGRVLAIEALPASLGFQTDVYLQYGREGGPLGQIPANVWFQFWIYINRYGDQMSELDRGKFIYPSRDGVYPASNGNPDRGNALHWLVGLGSNSREPLMETLTEGRGFFSNRPPNADFTAATEYPTNRDKLGVNLGTAAEGAIEPNRWYLVRVHVDTSGASPLVPAGQGVYQTWIRPMDGEWHQTSDWLGGVTPNFTWELLPGAADGSKTIRIPTTTTGQAEARRFDSWMYMDDFACGTREEDLPTYPR